MNRYDIEMNELAAAEAEAVAQADALEFFRAMLGADYTLEEVSDYYGADYYAELYPIAEVVAGDRTLAVVYNDEVPASVARRVAAETGRTVRLIIL